MARPRSQNYDEKRRAILDKAAALFAAQGFTGTSIASIAQYCGASKALLYHYYQSKESLLYDMLKSHCQFLLDTASEAVKQEEAPDRQLRNLIHSLMSLYMSSRDKHIVLLNDLHCLPAEQQTQVRLLEKKLVQVVKDLVVRLKPEIRPDDRTALAMYLMGSINWTYTWFRPDGPMTEHEYADMATSMFLRGLGANV